jgi:Flp pilus assembly protein TadG
MQRVKGGSLSSAKQIGRRGQSTVEFALLLPILLVLLFLVFEFGRAFGSWLLITNAAREGARNAAACSSSTSACITAAKGQVQTTAQFLSVQTADCNNNQPPAGNTSCVSVTYCPSGTSCGSPCPSVTPTDNLYCVVVNYQLQTLMPISGDIPFIGPINYPGHIGIIGLSTMRAE